MHVDNITEDQFVTKEKLIEKLQLIENVLRYQVLGNIDSTVSSLIKICTELKESLLVIGKFKSEFIDISKRDGTLEDPDSVSDAFNSIYESIIKLESTGYLFEQSIKQPIRVQFKALSGIRRFDINRIK
jgi:hypothetical protein